jgi:hypothetical protein
MATELWFPGVKEGWLSGFGTGDYKVSAELDGIDICYQGPDAKQLERAFHRAALRTVLRRWLPWIAPPAAERRFQPLSR